MTKGPTARQLSNRSSATRSRQRTKARWEAAAGALQTLIQHRRAISAGCHHAIAMGAMKACDANAIMAVLWPDVELAPCLVPRDMCGAAEEYFPP